MDAGRLRQGRRPAVGGPQHPWRVLQLPPAEDRAGVAGGGELGPQGGGHRVCGQAARRGHGDALHLRGRRDQPGGLPRGSELRRRAQAAGRLRLREQRLRDLGAAPTADAEPERCRARRGLRHGRRDRGRHRRAGVLRYVPGGGRSRSPGRGADAHRRQDLAPQLAHLRGQPGEVPRDGGDRPSRPARPDLTLQRLAHRSGLADRRGSRPGAEAVRRGGFRGRGLGGAAARPGSRRRPEKRFCLICGPVFQNRLTVPVEPDDPAATPSDAETSQMPAVAPDNSEPESVVWPEDPWVADGRAADDPTLENGPVVTSPVISTWPEKTAGEPSVPSHAGMNPIAEDPVTAPFPTRKAAEPFEPAVMRTTPPQPAPPAEPAEPAEEVHDTVPPAPAAEAAASMDTEEVDTADAALETLPPEVAAVEASEEESAGPSSEEAVIEAIAEDEPAAATSDGRAAEVEAEEAEPVEAAEEAPVPGETAEETPVPVETAEETPVPVETTEETPIPVEAAEPEPEPMPEPVPEPAPMPEPEPMPEPVTEPEPTPEPMKAEEPEPAQPVETAVEPASPAAGTPVWAAQPATPATTAPASPFVPASPAIRAGRQTRRGRPRSLSPRRRPSGPASTCRRGLPSRLRRIQARRIRCPGRAAHTAILFEHPSRRLHRRQLRLHRLPHRPPARLPPLPQRERQRPRPGRWWSRSGRPSRCTRVRAPRTSRTRNGLRGRRGQAPQPARATRRRREPSERSRLGMT